MNIIDGTCRLVLLLVMALVMVNVNEGKNALPSEDLIEVVEIPVQEAYKPSEVVYLTLYDDSEYIPTPAIDDNTIPVEEMNEMEFNVALCESTMNNEVVGDIGTEHLAYGLYQFQIRTFNYLSSLSGMVDLRIESASDQLTLFRWAVKNGYGRYWSCYNKLY